MKKITKLGLSALCGSLAVASAANAGDIGVSGSAEITYLTVDGNTTGHPFGMKSDLTFTGSGELDGGQKVTLDISGGDQAVFADSSIALTTNNIGTFTLSNGAGADLGDYDDKAPSAWEEAWDGGQGATTDNISGVASSTNVNWKSPATTGKIMGGTTLILAYTPLNNGTKNNDKSASGAGGNTGKGMDVVLDLRSGKKLSGFMGYSRTQKRGIRKNDHSAPDGHKEEAAIGLNYKLGPFSMGYQHTAEDLKAQGDGFTPEVDMYLNKSWGVAMNINGGLSVSYGEATSNKIWTSTGQTAKAGKYTHKRKQKSKAYNAAYTIGGVTMKWANSETTNAAYAEGDSNEATLVSLGIAF
jgi:hypothetical protein